ncbi:phosphotransferase [Bacillus sp. JCM 19034]|uniref:phosphotransferase n=1 Tax=Bacillus sp. JCM 19034 TaxID=1481928 RepID=UPI000781B700|nr:phosphotransferase [Bacillus sp. JCM 19034]
MFGFSIIESQQIELGYRNMKWKLKTNVGDLFVKQYNKIRYPDHMIQGLENSLSHQSNLFNEGIPCPQLYSYKGNYVIKTIYGERFVLMGLCDGKNIKAGKVTQDQMYSLGRVIGQMHTVLNFSSTDHPRLHWDVQSKERMLENWSKRWDEAADLNCNKLLTNLENQRKILERNNIDIFSECETGWTHWDLFVDNILFNTNSVSAILDFDRMHYVYPEFDISRPLLSGCINNGEIHLGKVSAFVEGYREYQKLCNQKLVRSIKLTWWKEASWLRVEKEETSTPLKRFVEENIWVADNWNDLENIFLDISYDK